MHTTWVATSYGALDVSSLPCTAEAGIDCMVLPTRPSEPIGLKDDAAALWRRLVAGPVPDSDLSPQQRTMVREFEQYGLASTNLGHPARTTTLPAPWFNSPLHELVYSLVAHLARESEVDVIFIKGPALHRQGLRDREDSGDVDVWADPQRIETLRDQLIPWGWRVKPDLWDSLFANHSVTLQPKSWGCEIDLHHHFPGIGISPQEAFAVLQGFREPLAFAGTVASVPIADAHAVISALHAARPEVGSTTTPPPLRTAEHLQRAGAGCLGVARQLRADAALESILAIAFPDDVTAPTYGPPLNWRWRAEPTKVRSYLMALRMIPIADRPRIFFRLLWPTSKVAWHSDSLAGGHARTVLGARVRRLARGTRQSLKTGSGTKESVILEISPPRAHRSLRTPE